MLSNFNQVLYVLCLYVTRPKYQVSVYRTIGSLVYFDSIIRCPVCNYHVLRAKRKIGKCHPQKVKNLLTYLNHNRSNAMERYVGMPVFSSPEPKAHR